MALVLALGAAQGVQAGQTEPLTLVTSSGRHDFRVEVVATPADRARGLMYRKSVPDGTGMLFDFQYQQPVSFWMKNTYVSLDMIFIRENGAIARIAQDTTPLSEKVVPSGVPVRYVLEVVSGTAKRLGIQPGDKVEGAGIGG
nr:DUF192 domain-containing protein [Breoghania corrubedonensis]